MSIESLTTSAADLLTVAAVLVGLAVLAASRDVRLGVGVLLDLFLAAGLLRLGADPQWHTVVTAAAVVALRKLVAGQLAVAERNS